MVPDDKIIANGGWRTAFYRRVILGDDYRRAEEVVREIDQWQPGHTERRQAETLRLAASHSPYLSRVAAWLPSGGTRLDDWPFLARATVRDNYAEFVVPAVGSQRRHHAWTGGSTGAPLRVVQDANFKLWQRATETWFMRRLMGIDPDAVPKVLFWASAARVWGAKITRRKRVSLWLTRTDLLGASRITPAEFEAGIEAINRRKPVLIKSYASCLHRLARHIREKNLRVWKPCVLFTTGEMMLPHMRADIEEVFEAPVHDYYGTRETGPVAGQCRRGRLHLFSFMTRAEIVDANGAPVAPGQEGRVILTTMRNEAMPLVRYDIGDNAVPAAGCDCGCALPALERIGGRLLEYLTAPDGTLVSGGYMSVVLYKRPWLSEYRVEQTALDEVVVTYVPRDRRPPEDEADIVGKIRFALGPGCRVVFREVPEIPVTGHGKRIFVRGMAGMTPERAPE